MPFITGMVYLTMRQKISLAFLLGFLGWTTPGFAQVSPALDSVIAHFVKHDRFMGAIAIAHGGNEPSSYYSGYASVIGHDLVDSTTTFRIGSISKMFTAVMILQLEQEGKLSINEPLSRYYPGVPNWDKITLKMLLNHTSGIHSITDDSTFLSYMETMRTHEEQIERIKAGGMDFKPEEQVSYSNSNFILLGYIIELVTGNSFQDEMNTRIVIPLGLKQTRFGFPGPADENEAFSYTYEMTWIPATQTHLSVPHGAGAVISTPADLCRFIEGLFAGKLISAKQLEKMTNTTSGAFGAGMIKFPYFEKTAFGHTGGIDGFVSQVAYFPEDSLAVAICMNGMRTELNDLALAVLNTYFEKPLVLPDFNIPVITLTAEQMQAYLGVYTSPDFPLEIKIFADKQGLRAQASGQSDFPLEAMNTLDFRFEPAKLLMHFMPSADEKSMIGLKLTQQGRTFEFSKKE